MNRRRRLFLSALVLIIVPVAALLAVSASSAEDQATSVSVSKDVVTITVNIDAPGLTRKEAKAWKADAETKWNDAFDRLPYKCFKLQLVVNVTAQPDDFEARADHHRIYRTHGVNGVVLKPHGDSTFPYEHATDGAWGDLPEGGFAHEVGHLMGMADDYIEVSTNPRVTKPKDGRNNTLMADGGPVDKALVDRLGDVLRKAGKLPNCWTGSSHSESTQVFQASGGFLKCTEIWNITFGVTVAPDGTATGTGTGNLLGQRNCTASFNWDFTDQTEFEAFDVTGHLGRNRFELQFIQKTSALVGGTGHQGLLNYTLFGPFPQPILVVSVVAPGKAEGTTTIKRTVDNGARAVGVHEVHMKCDISCEENVG